VNFESVDAPDRPNSTLTVSPSSVPADGKTTATVTVTLKNFADDPISAGEITLTYPPVDGSSLAPTATPNSNGVATFSVESSHVGDLSYTVSATESIVTSTGTQTKASPLGSVKVDFVTPAGA